MKKAYDSVDHSVDHGWLGEMMVLHRFPNNKIIIKSIYIALILCSAKRFTMQKKKISG